MGNKSDANEWRDAFVKKYAREYGTKFRKFDNMTKEEIRDSYTNEYAGDYNQFIKEDEAKEATAKADEAQAAAKDAGKAAVAAERKADKSAKEAEEASAVERAAAKAEEVSKAKVASAKFPAKPPADAAPKIAQASLLEESLHASADAPTNAIALLAGAMLAVFAMFVYRLSRDREVELPSGAELYQPLV